MLNTTPAPNQEAIEKKRANQLHDWIEKNKKAISLSESVKVNISLKGFKLFSSITHSFDS